jgi:hypothetical protein
LAALATLQECSRLYTARARSGAGVSEPPTSVPTPPQRGAGADAHPLTSLTRGGVPAGHSG